MLERLRLPRVLKPWKQWPLASQILVWVLGILIVTIALGGFLYSTISRQVLEHQYELRALGIASSVAQMPEIVADVESDDPAHEIRQIASRIRSKTGAAYVVVTNRQGVRFSHPRPSEIGKKLQEGVPVLDGKSYIGVDPGSLGRSANARVPIENTDGLVIGEVSVGILESQEADQFQHDIELIVAYSLLALVLALVGSLFLSRRIKRATFGLEPAAIATLLEEREALLHGIREGMVGFGSDGQVTVINEEAERLLGVGGLLVGKKPDDFLKPGRLRDVLTGQLQGADQLVITDDSLLVVNRMQVSLEGRDIGSVATIRDRTEVEGMVRELHAVSGLSDALRAQQHEYANRLYIIAGLLEMGDNEQVSRYVSEVASTPAFLGEGLSGRIAPPELAALLLAKITIAAEHGAKLTVSEDSHLAQELSVDTESLITIVGNLIDNAIEALAEQPGDREITAHLSDVDGVRITVTDNGPGLPAEKTDEIFADGYTTKQASPNARRGLGLALVSRVVRRAGGTIAVRPGPGGYFEVYIPPLPDQEPPIPGAAGQ